MSKIVTKEKLNDLQLTKIELQKEQDIWINAERNK